MFCKKFLALLLWCHCYHIVLDPFLHLLTLSLDQTHHQYGGGLYVAGAAAAADIKTQQTQIALTPGHEISLRCDMDGYPNANFTWSRVRQYPIKSKYFRSPDRAQPEELKPTNDQIIVNNNILVLKSPSYSDVGNYFCKLTDQDDQVGTISVRARPYILDFNLDSSTLKSAVIEEGTSLKIPCIVSDEYEPESKLKVKWYSSKYEEDDMNEVNPDEDGIKVETLGETNSVLVIDRITKDHRRYYKCHVENGVTENSKTILIRVKDKYTAIWPAVGIVIEIVILIGVIFIVENRKVEPDKEVYDRKAIQM